MASNSVFINYRHDASAILTLAIYQQLNHHHIDAFYDNESIKAGQVGEIILGAIAARPYFMPVLTPGTLERCIEPGDWVRREIEHALGLKRILVPLHTPDFDFNDLDRYLPDLAAAIKTFNRVELLINKLQYFKYAMQDVVENFLKPITIDLTPPTLAAAADVARLKQTLDSAEPVTEKQLNAQEYFERALARPKDDLDGMIADYTEAIRLNPQYANAYYNRGTLRDLRGDEKGAIVDHTEAIRFDPQYADAYNNRGLARAHGGDMDGAITDYTEAIRLNPQYADAYYNRGTLRGKKGDIDGTVADYDEAIRLNPMDAHAYYNRGITYANKGDKKQAAGDFRKALELRPNGPDAQAMRDYIAKYDDKA